MSRPLRPLAHRPFDSLKLEFESPADLQEYRRSLDLETGVVSVKYQDGGIRFRRRVIASHHGQAILVPP